MQGYSSNLPLPRPRHLQLIFEIPHPLAYELPEYGCGWPCGSFPHAPTVADELRSVPGKSGYVAVPAGVPAGLEGLECLEYHACRASSVVGENNESDGFAPSGLAAAFADEEAD